MIWIMLMQSQFNDEKSTVIEVFLEKVFFESY